ncbi:trypsin-like peptidase domain-containing protein [Streptomyces sp. NPDC059037]|uniref:VMAP-C domain-containing protein n=1 Tax=Streptomyces sp. NPDC059037 TaxID=3346710 RepID=UPI0036CBB54F
MGWFLTEARSPSADPRHCVVSVLRTRDVKTAGAGVLLTSGRLLTCAHVVNDALGRHLFDTRHPGRETVHVTLRGPSASVNYATRVAYWIPPRRRDGADEVREKDDHEWLGDLAVLRLDSVPHESVAAPMWQPMAPGQSLRAWHGSGLSSSFADVRVKTCDESIGYVDGEPTGMAIGPAFSGGPLWSVTDNAAVGLVVAHIMPPADPATGAARPFSSQHVSRRSWGIPWQRIEAELRGAGAGELLESAEADPDDPALPVLTELIEGIMPSPVLRGDHARAVARRCGHGHPGGESAPTPEEFARLLVTDPRALAALTEVLRRPEPAAVRPLLNAGQFSPVPRLLSPDEHRKLDQTLKSIPAATLARLPEAVRAALPLAAAFPGDDSPDGCLDHLERLGGDSRTEGEGPRVPALVRVMEYLAALCPPAQCARLRLWSDGVAKRLGIPRSALAERRSDAVDWARTQAEQDAPLRVLVQVSRSGEDRYRLRVWCDEGAGPRQVSTDGEVTFSAAKAARELLRVLESLHQASPSDRRPLVEALVDRAGLNLPIDEWESFGPDDLVPGVLGAEYPLVVNCPELLRRNERFLPDWRRRWRQLDTGISLLFADEALGLREIYGTLMDRVDAVRVAVDVPPRLRDEVVQVCLAVGVPIVVWDRGLGRESHAVARMSGVTTRELPEGVRSYRAKTVHQPRAFPGRPVLAWADPDRTVPQLHLSEPQEGL